MSNNSTAIATAATVAAVTTGILAYAAYFDYRRRTNPEFRKQLRRDERKQMRAAREEATAARDAQIQQVRAAVDQVRAEGFPQGADEKEQYFMESIAQGEQLATSPATYVEAAIAFYKGLKIYPSQRDLMGIYDKTVPKPVLDILAEMIAYDGTVGRNQEPSMEDILRYAGLDLPVE